MATTKSSSGQAAGGKSDIAASIESKLVGGKNSCGIPEAVFVEDVGSFISSVPGADVSHVLGGIQELLSKYKFMDSQLISQVAKYRSKIPEIQLSLDAVKHLEKQHEEGGTTKSRFALSDSVYATAEIDNTADSVGLWLGANVMLEYPLKEAVEVLEQNLSNTKSRLSEVEKDRMFLKDQIITSEVNMARVFNYDVMKRREMKAQEAITTQG